MSAFSYYGWRDGLDQEFKDGPEGDEGGFLWRDENALAGECRVMRRDGSCAVLPPRGLMDTHDLFKELRGRSMTSRMQFGAGFTKEKDDV